jgi:hypothetical protein
MKRDLDLMRDLLLDVEKATIGDVADGGDEGIQTRICCGSSKVIL